MIIRLPQRDDAGMLRGELTDKGDDWLEITRPDGVPVEALIFERTRFRIPGVEDPGLDDLDIGDRVFARGLWNEERKLQAGLVGIMPDAVQDILAHVVLHRRGP